MARATSSLPTPLSPEISTVALVGAARLIGVAAPACSARALADDLVAAPRIARFSDRFSSAQPAAIERVADRDEHALARERLLDEVERAELRRLDRRRSRCRGRRSSTTGSVSSSACERCSTSRPSMPGILMSRNTRSGALALDHARGLLAGGRAEELVALVLEDHPQRVADGRLVVDDQDARFHGFTGVLDRRGSDRRRVDRTARCVGPVGHVEVERQHVARRARCAVSRR